MKTKIYFIVILNFLFYINLRADSGDSTKFTFGFEFSYCIENSWNFKFPNVAFNGAGEGFTETKYAGIENKCDLRQYEVSIFIRYKWLKFGWKPSISKSFYFNDPDFRLYEYKYDNRTSTLGGYSLNFSNFNLGYFEIIGLKNKQNNLFANVLLELNMSKIKGNIYTYKYPFGDEWYQPKIVLNDNEIEENIIILSIGPKIAAKNIFKEKTNNHLLNFVNKIQLTFMFDFLVENKNFSEFDNKMTPRIIGGLDFEL